MANLSNRDKLFLVSLQLIEDCAKLNSATRKLMPTAISKSKLLEVKKRMAYCSSIIDVLLKGKSIIHG